MFLRGVMLAIIVLIECVFFNVFIRLAGLHSELNGILFACLACIGASFILLLYAGPGRLASSTIKNWATWAYGICVIWPFALDIYLVKYISATELSLFSRVTIPLSIIMAFLFLKRKPAKQDFIAVACIIVSSLLLIKIQAPEHVNMIIILVLLMAFFWAAEFMLTEVHTQSVSANESGNLKDRARVVGFVSFVSSLMFLTVCFAVSLLKNYGLLDNVIVAEFPNLSQYLDSYTVTLAILYGVFITSFTRFCTWSATYKIKTENLLAILVFIPILTYLSEKAISNIFNIELNSVMLEGERGQYIFIALILMTAGSAISIIPKVLQNINRKENQSWFSAFKESIKQQDNNYEVQHDAIDSSDYTIIQQTVAFYENDYEKTAKLYGITSDAVKVILAGNGNNCFIAEVSKKIQKIYQENVVVKDKLTGCKNRIALSMDMYKLITKDDIFSVILLDLNDFKPVNDKYGHSAGDFILHEFAKRLESKFANRVYRLGGDEFVVLLQKEATDEDVRNIKDIIANKCVYEGIELAVSSSIGIANFKQHGLTKDDLLDYADKQLYKDKTNKVK